MLNNLPDHIKNKLTLDRWASFTFSELEQLFKAVENRYLTIGEFVADEHLYPLSYLREEITEAYLSKIEEEQKNDPFTLFP